MNPQRKNMDVSTAMGQAIFRADAFGAFMRSDK
jgi:hypothetical protein